jgi:predicted O-methyltransferase YrrM
MRLYKPRKIIEVGSGFSSAAMLDVNELFCDGQIQFNFIEPNPSRLQHLLLKKDLEKVNIIKKRVQEVSLETFNILKENDILFIDSSHVAKTDSDVLHICFNILPTLNEGVIIHFHDILWPFEYPKLWYDQGRIWNEAYMLRAFLQFNTAFEIIYFNSFMELSQGEFLNTHLPLMMKMPESEETLGNTSLWIRKKLHDE